MPGDRPKPPALLPAISLPQIGDAAVAKAFADLAERLRALEARPRPVTADGRRGFALGSDAMGDLYYRARDGSIARIPPGTPGQVLTMGADGLPGWV